MRGSIVRWTTPIIVYKPSQAEIADIEEIFVVLKQKGIVKLKKGIEDASIDEEGFTWQFSQEETGTLQDGTLIKAQIDYKTVSGQRYTTNPVSLEPTESAVDEVI